MSNNPEPSITFRIPPSPSGHKKSPSETSTSSPFLNEPSNSSVQRRLSNASALSIDESLSVNFPNIANSSLDLPPKTTYSSSPSSIATSSSASASLNPFTNGLSGSPLSPIPSSSALGVPSSSSSSSSPPNAFHYRAASVSSPSGGAGREWGAVKLSELVQRENLVSVTEDTTVEKAFETLSKNKFTSLPIKAKADDTFISDTFDYADLNAYLLMVMCLTEPVNSDDETLAYVEKARAGGSGVPVKFAAHLGAKNELHVLKSNSTIIEAVEILGRGVHRVAIADAQDANVTVGVLSQRRLIRFIWENGRQFKSLEPFFQMKLTDLGIGPKDVVSINGDRQVIEALKIMHEDGVSSVAVTDSSRNLLGNISIVDVRLVTKSSQKHLLRTTCKQFLSTILNERGLDDGQDSFPVFHVTLGSSVGRTIAKLVATKAHRLWIVQPPQQKADTSTASTSTVLSSAVAGGGGFSTASGQLIGVVSLTDILNKLAKQVGRDDLDPHFARRQRRRSSSSSVRSFSSAGAARRSISIDRGQR